MVFTRNTPNSPSWFWSIFTLKNTPKITPQIHFLKTKLDKNVSLFGDLFTKIWKTLTMLTFHFWPAITHHSPVPAPKGDPKTGRKHPPEWTTFLVKKFNFFSPFFRENKKSFTFFHFCHFLDHFFSCFLMFFSGVFGYLPPAFSCRCRYIFHRVPLSMGNGALAPLPMLLCLCVFSLYVLIFTTIWLSRNITKPIFRSYRYTKWKSTPKIGHLDLSETPAVSFSAYFHTIRKPLYF